MMMPSIFGERTYLMMIGWISRLTDLTENSGEERIRYMENTQRI